QAAPMFAPGFHVPPESARELGTMRAAIRERRKVVIEYVNRAEVASNRLIRPLGLFFWGTSWTVAAWCELRVAFRAFRLDRVQRIWITDEQFEDERNRTLQDFFDNLRDRRS